MKVKHLICTVGLVSCCTIASTDLTLVPTQTHGFERNFNPFDATVGSFYATDFIYEPLWIFNVWNPDNDYPRLAESVQLADDYLSVTYQLRRGVKWSDGQPFTAEDVVFTVDYARQHPSFPVNVPLYDAINGTGLVTDAVVVDKHTVRFELSSANAMAHQSIGGMYPLPKHVFAEVAKPTEFTNANPVGTGPFTEVSVFRTTNFKLCTNPHYYLKEALNIDCLKFPTYSGTEQLWAAARRGKIDWMGEGISDPGAQYEDHLATNKVWLAPGAATVMQVNTTRAPLDQAKVRQALSMAIDRQRLLEVDTFGLTSPMTWPVATGPLYQSWYEADALAAYKPLMEYNPDSASALLDDAGIIDSDGDGWRELSNGEPFNLGIAVPSSWVDWYNSVGTIAENFRAIGVNASIEGMSADKWFNRIPSGDFDLYMMWTNPGITPWKIYSEMFTTTNMVPGRIEGQAMHQLQSKDVNRWLDEFTLTADKSRQHQLITNVQKAVAEQMPVISLFANPVWYQYSTKNFSGWVSPENPYVRPQIHKGVPERLIHVLNLTPVTAQ